MAQRSPYPLPARKKGLVGSSRAMQLASAPSAPAVAPVGFDPAEARRQALSETFGDGNAFRPLEGTGPINALGRVAEVVMANRGHQQEAEREGQDRARVEQTRTQEEQRAQERRQAIAAALAAYNNPDTPADGRQAAMIAALGGGAPEEGLEMAQTQAQRAAEREAQANAPITPYQRESLDLQRRGQDVRSSGAGPSGMGRVPSGYRLSADGQSLEPMVGGPAAARVGAAERARMTGLMGQMQANTNVLTSISEARQLAGSGETGAMGSVMSNVPGTRAHDLSATIDSIVANIGFDRLQAMRDSSPTGGALGQVTERELALLQAVVASLRQSQSQEQFLRNLDRVEQTYRTSMARIQDAYQQDFGGADEGSAPSAAPAASGPAPGEVQDGYRFLGGDPANPASWEQVR